jgi:hypothetical protein
LTMPEEVQLDKCIHEPPKCPKRIPSKNLWIKLLDAIVCRAHVLLSSWNRWLVINNSVRSVLLSPGCISRDFTKKFAYQYVHSVPLCFSGGAWQACLMIIYLQHTIEQSSEGGLSHPFFMCPLVECSQEAAIKWMEKHKTILHWFCFAPLSNIHHCFGIEHSCPKSWNCGSLCCIWGPGCSMMASPAYCISVCGENVTYHN